mmetsp:Transcript_19285/g.25409  ORF Transcript_19285/g.25409 Transcript_19285/m.25409 type:complete len:1336 (+) Transcript_19285:117-4124(+)
MGFMQDLEKTLSDTKPSTLDLSSDYVKLKISFLDAEENKKLLNTISSILTHHEKVHDHIAQGVRDVKQYTKDKIVQAADASDDHRGRIEFLETRLATMERQLLTLAQNIEGETIENEQTNAAEEIVRQITAANEKQATIYISDSEEEDDFLDDNSEGTFDKEVKKVEKRDRKFTLSDVPIPDMSKIPSSKSLEPAPEELREEPTVINQSLNSNVVVEEMTLDLANQSKDLDESDPEVTDDIASEPEAEDGKPPKTSSRKAPSVKSSPRASSRKSPTSSRKSPVSSRKSTARSVEQGSPKSPASSRKSSKGPTSRKGSSQSDKTDSDKAPSVASKRSLSRKSSSRSKSPVSSRKSSKQSVSSTKSSPHAKSPPKSAKSEKRDPEDAGEEPEITEEKPKIKKQVTLPDESSPEDSVEFDLVTPRDGGEEKTGIKARVGSATVRRLSKVSGASSVMSDQEPRRTSTASNLPERPKTAPSLSRAGSEEDMATLVWKTKTERRKSLRGVMGHPFSGRKRVKKLYSGRHMRKMMENPRKRWQQGIQMIMERTRLVDEGGVLSKPVKSGMSLQERVFRLEEQSNNAFTPSDGKHLLDKIEVLEKDLGESKLKLGEAQKDAEQAHEELEKLKHMMGQSLAANTIVEEVPMITKRLEIVEKKAGTISEVRDLVDKQQERLNNFQDEMRRERTRRRSIIVAPKIEDDFSLDSKGEPKEQAEEKLEARRKTNVVAGMTAEDKVALESAAGAAEMALGFKEQQEDWLIQRATQLKDRVLGATQRAEAICSKVLVLTKDTQEHFKHKDAVNLLAQVDMDLREPLRELQNFLPDVAAHRHEDAILRTHQNLLGNELESNDIYTPFVESLKVTEEEFEKISDKVIEAQGAIKEHSEALAKCSLRFLQLLGAMQSKEAMMRLHSQLMERLDNMTGELANFVTKDEFGAQHQHLNEDIHRISNMYGAQAQTVDELTNSIGNATSKTSMMENRIGELEAQVYVPDNRFKPTNNVPMQRSQRPSFDMEKVNAQIKAEVSKMVDLYGKKQQAEEQEVSNNAAGIPTDADEIKKIQDELEFTIQKVEGLYATKADMSVVDTKAAKSEVEKKADKSAVRNLEQFMAQFGDELGKTRNNTDKALHKMRAQLEAQLLNALEEHFESNPQVPSAMAKHDSWLCMSCHRPATAPLKPHQHQDMAPVKNPTGIGYSDVLRAGFRMPLQLRGEHASPREHGLRPITSQQRPAGFSPNQSINSQMSRSTSDGFKDYKRYDSGNNYFPSTGRPGSGTRSTGNLSTGRPGTTKKKKKMKKDIAGSWLQVDRIKPGPLFQVDAKNNQRSEDLASQVEKLNQKMLKKL